MTSKSNLPSSRELVWPIMQTLRKTGGTATKMEIDVAVVTLLQISDELARLPHDKSRTEIQYRSAWALTYGKRAGYLANPSRNQWALTDIGRQVRDVSSLKL